MKILHFVYNKSPPFRRNMADSRRFEFTTEFWTTTSSWYNTTSSFTTQTTPVDREPQQIEDILEGTTVELDSTTTVLTTNTTFSTSTSFFEPTYATEDNATDNDGMAIIPMITKDGLELSKIMFAPFCVILVISTAILLYLILGHFRHLIRLYLSLIFYSTCQLFLFAVLAILAITQTFVSLSGACDAVNAIEFLAIILPGYGILAVSVARWLCVAYPTRYQKLLNPRVQVVVMVVLVSLLALMTCLPVLGICSNVWVKSEELEMGGYCHLAEEGCQCTVFRWILVSVGFIFPFLGVLVVYCLIVNLLIKHKKKEKSLGKCKGSEKCDKVDYNYKPVSIGEKLSHLKAIGQDAIPWSIILILILNTLTTLPWIPQIFAPKLYLSKLVSEYLALDLLYVVMLGAISISPATYFLTTPGMRAEFARLFSKNSRHKQFSVMSKNTESTVDV